MELKDFYNGFEISLDWLEFTLFDLDIVHCCNMFGLDFTDFSISDKGALGYTRYAKHRLYSIAIFWCGNDDMGCHFRVTGSALFYFFNCFMNSKTESTPFVTSAIDVDVFTRTYFPILFKLICDNGKITRLDIALDDFTGAYYNTESILDNLLNCKVISKFKTFQNIQKNKICDSSSLGHTIYFGSRTSDVFLRVYDKKLEKNVNIDFWNRWEFEIKGDKIIDFINIVLNYDNFGSLFFELLNNYLRFIELDRSERKNCSSQQKWLDFLGNVKKTSLSVHKSIKTIDSKKEWLERQCFPTLAGLVKYYDGDMSFIYDKLECSYDRNKLDNKMLFSKEVDYVIQ